MPFSFQELEIPGVILIESRRFTDTRGFFLELYKASEFVAHGIPTFIQDNCSHSVHGVLRGLHYQLPPKAQGKLVMAFSGRVFDVAVDIRQHSPTYRKWVGVELSADNGHMLYIPPGLAHGFCVLSEETDFVYKVTEEYAPELERGIIWNDPEIGIQWPIAEPIVSPRDAQLPSLEQVCQQSRSDLLSGHTGG
jgi:dTDP-4-dehydrorhamnose 3,5-epimerase